MKKNKFNIKEVRVHMGLFDFTVVAITGDYKEAYRYVAWKFEDKDLEKQLPELEGDYESRGKCFHRVGYVPVIWIPRKPKTAREHATLAHECLHAVYHLHEWSLVPLGRDTEEMTCHALAHLYTNILKQI